MTFKDVSNSGNPDGDTGMTDKSLGQVLCFVSPKGGTGKTLFSATASYLLQKSGLNVVAIDADFSTRGLSLYLLGDILQSKELDIASKHCLADAFLESIPVEKITPLTIDAGWFEHNVVISNRDVWRGGVPDERFLGGLPNEPTATRIGPTDYFHFLDRLCQRFRRQFDYVIIDTRGGYDFTTAAPAVAADGYVIVLEADAVSINQVHGFKMKLDQFAQSLAGTEEPRSQAHLKGFIVNKAISQIDNFVFPEQLLRIYGAKTFGVVPVDRDAIRAYQKKEIPAQEFPESEFSYYSLKAIEHLIAPSENWQSLEAKNKFQKAAGEIRSSWVARKRVELLQAAIPFCLMAMIAISTLCYFGYKRGAESLLPIFYVAQALFTIAAVAGALLSSISLWRKSKRGRLSTSIVSLFLCFWGLALVWVIFDIPRTFSSGAYAERVKAQDETIDSQRRMMDELEERLADAQAKADFSERDKQVAQQDLKSEQRRTAELQRRISELGSKQTAGIERQLDDSVKSTELVETVQTSDEAPLHGFMWLGNDLKGDHPAWTVTGEDGKTVPIIDQIKPDTPLIAQGYIKLRKNKPHKDSNSLSTVGLIKKGQKVITQGAPDNPLRGQWWVEVEVEPAGPR